MLGGDSSTVKETVANGVQQANSTYAAFDAVKGDGSVITRGDAEHGGDSYTVKETIASGVQQFMAPLPQ